jgi:DNA-binding transcriptional regulator LsrR (DeoR family)
MQAIMDIALFGLGSPFSGVISRVYAGGYLEKPEFDALSAAGVVGDVATVFYRADGSADGIALNQRSTGPDFTVLRRTPRRICVVADRSKLSSLCGALAANLITDLFVDESTARALVEAP